MYQVIGHDGRVSTPFDLPTLKEMARDSRLDPQQMLIDPISGSVLPAAQMLDSQVVFAAVQTMPPVQTAQAPSADASLLGVRFGGYLIDALCSIPLVILALIPFVGLLFAPLLGLYWLSRDSFFGGQSIGKKAVGLRVVRLDGQPVVWGTSVQRNIAFLPLMLAAIPFAGAVIGPGLMGVINIVEIVMVIATQRRIGDNIARTVVVRA